MRNVKKILVVEDDLFLTNIYRSKLGEAGFSVEAASDGHAALSKLEEYSPDVILLDIVMPKMNGFELIKRIKADSRWHNVPILVITNLAEQADEQKARELGATDFVIKTGTPIETIVEKVQNFLTTELS